jgi:cyclase
LFRVIARLDVKPPHLVKGIHLEGLRKIGSPIDYALRYYKEGVDEIQYQDIVASLYKRESILNLISETAERVFVPLTVGGGVRNLDDALSLVRHGADKVVVNTGAINDPTLITKIANELGSQAVVLAIEVIRRNNSYSCLTNSGRETTKIQLEAWISEAEDRGCGEILVTSIDAEGTMRGPDYELIEFVRQRTILPMIAHGGFSSFNDVYNVATLGVDAVSLASIIHFNHITIKQLKEYLFGRGVDVRISHDS